MKNKIMKWNQIPELAIVGDFTIRPRDRLVNFIVGCQLPKDGVYEVDVIRWLQFEEVDKLWELIDW
jgi:hypothetical protein